jgi:hypothetical protein
LAASCYDEAPLLMTVSDPVDFRAVVGLAATANAGLPGEQDRGKIRIERQLVLGILCFYRFDPAVYYGPRHTA